MRDLDKDLELCEKATPGPLKWQKFGKQYYLTGQYGMRPIIFATVTAEIKGVCKSTHISNRDAESDLLIPLNPNHPDSKFVEEAWEALPYWLGEVKRLRRMISEATEKMLPLISERDLLIKTNAELQEEGKRLEEALNAINNLAIKCEREDPDSAWEYMADIYNMSLLPEEAE